MKGKVYLVGAGPGDPELLTLKALRILKSADAVLHDDLIGAGILALVAPTAFTYNVGKRCGRKSTPQEKIDSLLVTLASSGLQVVRLKGGDPFVFGRGGEEIQALREGRIVFEIVPGVTAALGAASAAHIPLTHRHFSSALVFLTSHRSADNPSDDWRPFVSSKATLVIYMPGQNYEATAQRLTTAGLKKNTPCAIVSRATAPDQLVYLTTIAKLPSVSQLPAPTLLIVGEVARLGDAIAAPEIQSALLAGQQSYPLQTNVSQEESLYQRQEQAS